MQVPFMYEVNLGMTPSVKLSTRLANESAPIVIMTKKGKAQGRLGRIAHPQNISPLTISVDMLAGVNVAIIPGSKLDPFLVGAAVRAGKGWMVGAEPSGQETKKAPAMETTERRDWGASKAIALYESERLVEISVKKQAREEKGKKKGKEAREQTNRWEGDRSRWPLGQKCCVEPRRSRSKRRSRGSRPRR
jgi:hypothetical protein